MAVKLAITLRILLGGWTQSTAVLWTLTVYLRTKLLCILDAPILAKDDPDELAISNGGAATTAYTRLQFEEIEACLRQRICDALLRYCELDTLAMAMIVQGWEEFSQLNSNNKNH
jgi:hypothetical protein